MRRWLLLLGFLLCTFVPVLAQEKAKEPPPPTSKEQLKADLDQLKSNKETLLKQISTIDGAIQYCQALLDRIDIAEKAAAAKEKDAKAKSPTDAKPSPAPPPSKP